MPKEKMSPADFFGREYFDSGRAQSGQFETYTLESKHHEFGHLAAHLASMFHPRNMLDVGCAKGFLVLAFRNLGIESFGVDLSSYALSQAPVEIRKDLSNVDLNQERLPFGDHVFDLITALGVLEYVSNISHALNELRRVISHNGLLFIRTYYPKHSRKWMQYYFEKVEGLELRDEKAWISVLESHGFEFMMELTNKNYPVYIQQRLEDDLVTGRGLKYSLGRSVYAIPEFGRWALVRRMRSKIGLLFLKPR